MSYSIAAYHPFQLKISYPLQCYKKGLCKDFTLTG